MTGKVAEFASRSQIVHIDIDPSEINKIKKVQLPICSDLKYALAELNKVVQPPADLSEWHRKIDAWKRSDPLDYDRDFDGILPQHALDLMWQLTKDRETIVCTGVGQHQMWSAQYYKFRQPRRWISSLGLGTMGFGLPCAMGAKAAHPDTLVINVDGDGSMLMNIQEMATCFTEKLPVKVLLLNNMHLGMVVQWEDRFHASNRAILSWPHRSSRGDRTGRRHHACGALSEFCRHCQGVPVGRPANIEERGTPRALLEMINAPGPYLLDVQVPYQEHVMPMIPGGMTVKDLIKK